MLMHIADMSPEQATLTSQEWLENERMQFTGDIPMLSLIQSLQPSTSQSSLGLAPTDPNLFGVVDHRNAFMHSTVNIGPETETKNEGRRGLITRVRGTLFRDCARRREVSPDPAERNSLANIDARTGTDPPMQFGDELTREQRIEMDEALDDTRRAGFPPSTPRLYDDEANNTTSAQSFMMQEQQLIDEARLRGLTVVPTHSPVEYSLARPETRSRQPRRLSDGGGRYDQGANATPAPRTLTPQRHLRYPRTEA
jgi:hypothetical protein